MILLLQNISLQITSSLQILIVFFILIVKSIYYSLIVSIHESSSIIVISQTLKHVWDMFNFNTTSNPHGYLVLFVSKTLSVVWYFIMDLILLKVHGYFTLFESKYMIIFICTHCLIISFKLYKFTQTLHGVFLFPNLNSYIVFHETLAWRSVLVTSFVILYI